MTPDDGASTSGLAGLDDVEWVFGYGSLMWEPGFEHLDARPATLPGYHRSFCLYSHHYRGTREAPGLVLGLNRGGSCRGIAFRVARECWREAVAYLDERELIGYAYLPRIVDIEIDGAAANAYTFVADADHPHYAGDLGIERSADLIMNAAGKNGLNRDYLIRTVRKLEDEGFLDPSLHDLLASVEQRTGALDMGAGI